MGLAEERKEEKGLGAEGVGPVYKAARQSGHPLRLPACEPPRYLPLRSSSCLRNTYLSISKENYKTQTQNKEKFHRDYLAGQWQRRGKEMPSSQMPGPITISRPSHLLLLQASAVS